MSESLPVMSCAGCGACCTNMGHPRFWQAERGAAGDSRWMDLPPELQDEIETHIRALEDVDIGQPCIWYNAVTKQCRHYEYRPQICRDFEAGSFHCLRMRFEQGIAKQFGM